MAFKDILVEAAMKDFGGGNPKGLSYSEIVKDGKLFLKLSSAQFPEANIEASIPLTGKSNEENYLRLYFLNMVYNAAILGTIRSTYKKKHKQNKN